MTFGSSDQPADRGSCRRTTNTGRTQEVHVTHGHAIVWLDHRRAVIIEFSADDHRITNIHGETAAGKLHQKSGKPGSGHAPDDVELYLAIVHAVAAPEVLVVGPGTAKS